MIKLNKIYTKTGDGGDTALGNGDRVLKDSLRVSAYGNVDELNASIGVVTLYATAALKGKLKNIILRKHKNYKIRRSFSLKNCNFNKKVKWRGSAQT